MDKEIQDLPAQNHVYKREDYEHEIDYLCDCLQSDILSLFSSYSDHLYSLDFYLPMNSKEDIRISVRLNSGEGFSKDMNYLGDIRIVEAMLSLVLNNSVEYFNHVDTYTQIGENRGIYFQFLSPGNWIASPDAVELDKNAFYNSLESFLTKFKPIRLGE